MAQQKITLTSTLQQVKDFLRGNYKDGCECPACGQHVKLYERKITSAMAYGLILLCKSGYRDFFHVEDYLKGTNCPSSIRGDISKLKYFGLIEREDKIRKDGSARAGYYRVTEKGINFVKNNTTVPKSVNLYNNKAYGFSEEHTNIQEALGQKFNYSELMAA